MDLLVGLDCRRVWERNTRQKSGILIAKIVIICFFSILFFFIKQKEELIHAVYLPNHKPMVCFMTSGHLMTQLIKPKTLASILYSNSNVI